MTIRQIAIMPSHLSAAITETTIKAAAGVSIGAEATKQMTEAMADVGVTTALSAVSMTVAIVAGMVAILSAFMNYRINNIRLEMEREEHRARMEEIRGLRNEPIESVHSTGTADT